MDSLRSREMFRIFKRMKDHIYKVMSGCGYSPYLKNARGDVTCWLPSGSAAGIGVPVVTTDKVLELMRIPLHTVPVLLAQHGVSKRTGVVLERVVVPRVLLLDVLRSRLSLESVSL